MILLPADDGDDDESDDDSETDAGDDANVPDADDADDSTTTLVMVQDINGRTKHVMADLDVWDVNDVLQSLGYPTDVDLRIMFAGKQLVPGSSLASYGIEPQSVPLHRGPAILKLIGRAHGGSQRVAEKKNRLRNEKAVRERLVLEGDTTLTSEEISTMMAERGCVEGGRLGWAFNPKQIEMKDRLLKKLAWRRTTPSSVGEAASSSGAAAAVYEKQNKKKDTKKKTKQQAETDEGADAEFAWFSSKEFGDALDIAIAADGGDCVSDDSDRILSRNHPQRNATSDAKKKDTKKKTKQQAETDEGTGK